MTPDLFGEPKKAPDVKPVVTHTRRRAGLTDPPEFLPVTDQMIAWHKSQRLPGDPVELMEAMLDYHRANGLRKKDWIASWRTWCRNQRAFENRRNGVAKSEQATKLTRSYIEQHALPGESYEEAERRLSQKR